jgi:hypothetical protein
MINSEEKYKIFILSREPSYNWIQIDDFEYKQFINSLRKFVKIPQKYNDIVGFMNQFRTGDVVFKIKDLRETKNKGGYCQQLAKPIVLQRINSIIENPVYSNEFIEQKIQIVRQNPNGPDVTKTMVNGIYKIGLCVILEILLRYFSETQYKDKIWFLTPEEAIINKFPDYKR